MQTKITGRYHILPVSMAIICYQIANVGKDMEKRELYYAVGGIVNWCGHCGKQYGAILKN